MRCDRVARAVPIEEAGRQCLKPLRRVVRDIEHALPQAERHAAP
jgi:hypothetical protein